MANTMTHTAEFTFGCGTFRVEMREWTITIFQKSVRDNIWWSHKRYDIRRARPADYRWSLEARAERALVEV